jgi:hypothetical protein
MHDDSGSVVNSRGKCQDGSSGGGRDGSYRGGQVPDPYRHLEDSSDPAPVLLRVGTSAGHGGGKPAAKAGAEAADRLAFIDAALGAAAGGRGLRQGAAAGGCGRN